MLFPVSTGAVASLLGTHEPRLNDLARRGKLDPLPPVTLGRRLWQREHVLRAAVAQGLSTDRIESIIDILSSTPRGTFPEGAL